MVITLVDISRVVVELSLMFDVDIKDITAMRSRKQNVMDAKRFLIYYLWKNKGVKHYHMKQYINGIHHASSMYHCKLIEDLFDAHEQYRRKYFEFVYKIDWA